MQICKSRRALSNVIRRLGYLEIFQAVLLILYTAKNVFELYHFALKSDFGNLQSKFTGESNIL